MKQFPIDFLEPFEKSSKQLNVVVETPKGSRVKYAYDNKKGMFIISKALPEGMVFPFNFGFVPGFVSYNMILLNAKEQKMEDAPAHVCIKNQRKIITKKLMSALIICIKNYQHLPWLIMVYM